jgi:hypothetical protein
MSQQRAHRGDTSEGPFLLPSSGFFADESLGAGHVHLPDDFFGLERDRQLGILAGWRSGVDQLWRRSLVEAFREGVGSGDPDLPLPARIERASAGFVHCSASSCPRTSRWPSSSTEPNDRPMTDSPEQLDQIRRAQLQMIWEHARGGTLAATAFALAAGVLRA